MKNSVQIISFLCFVFLSNVLIAQNKTFSPSQIITPVYFDVSTTP